MGQYTIKDIQDQAELLKADVQRIYRSLYTKLGFFPKSLDQVPYYIIQRLYPSPTKEALTITPSTTEQQFSSSDSSKYDPIIVNAVDSSIDGNIIPENIKEGVSILGVAGTLSAGGGSDVFVVPPEMRFAYSTFTEIPSNLDFSNITDMSNMFNYCSYLTSIPQLDTSKVTNMHRMLSDCEQLTTIPQLDTSKVTDMGYMFNYCPYLTSIPQLDTSKVTDMSSMFYGCSSLTTIPQLDTSKAINMDSMFDGCSSLTTVEGIDFSGFTSSPSYLFGYTSSMPNITKFIVNGKINVSISDDYSIKALIAIDYDSVKSILAAADRTDNTDAKELAFNRTMTDQNGELAALVSSCTSKGWTITGLTLQ